MEVALEIILLIAVAFAVGVVLGIVLKGRSNRRQVSPLATSVLLPIEENGASLASREEPAAAVAEPEASKASAQPAEPEPPATEAPSEPLPAASRRVEGAQPKGLEVPQGVADDLKVLRGIGPQNERKLNAIGIFHIAQIAHWTPEEAQWVGAALGFPGRVEREDWVGQARALLGASQPMPAGPQAEVEAPLFPELDVAPSSPRPRRRR